MGCYFKYFSLSGIIFALYKPKDPLSTNHNDQKGFTGMKETVILISRNENESDQINAFLSDNHYRLHTMGSIEDLDQDLLKSSAHCVILDLDSVSIDNRTIRENTLRYPHVYFLCMSRDRFHPELKDAICYHIYACLNKPLDYDELLYWLRCIKDNNNDSDEKNNNP